MPNMPVSTVSGRKIVEMMVSVFITWFRRFDVNDRWASRSDVIRSWNSVASSARRTR